MSPEFCNVSVLDVITWLWGKRSTNISVLLLWKCFGNCLHYEERIILKWIVTKCFVGRWKAVPSRFLHFIVNSVTHLHIVHRVRRIETIRRFGSCIYSVVKCKKEWSFRPTGRGSRQEHFCDMFCCLQVTHVWGDNNNNRLTADDTIISENRLLKQFVNRFVRRNAQGCWVRASALKTAISKARIVPRSVLCHCVPNPLEFIVLQTS